MKRISTAAVAAATALSLATVPAMAQENTAAATTTTPAATTTTPAATTTPSQPSETTTPATTQPSETTTPATTQPSQPTTTTPKPQQQKQSSGSSQGTLVGIFSGTLGAVLTTSLIVFSDPRGANKIIDMVNAQFGLGLPHLHTPKVELPNFQLPNLPF